MDTMKKENIIWIYEEWGSSSETWDFSYQLCRWDGHRLFVYYRPNLIGFLKTLFKRYKVIRVEGKCDEVTEEMYVVAQREAWDRFIGRWIIMLGTFAALSFLVASMVKA